MQRYCPSCGQDVPTTSELSGSYVMFACTYCGLGLGISPATEARVRALSGEQGGEAPLESDGRLGRVVTTKREMRLGDIVERGVASDARNAPGARAAAPLRQMRTVFVVEDSGFLRQVIGDILVERQLCKEVVGFDDGPAFIEAFARGLSTGKRPDLIVLDVRMPEMDGRAAAILARTLEKAFDSPKRVPILFFSAVLCDAEFKATLKTLGSARYIRKIDGDVQSLGERVAAVLAKLIGA